MRFINKRATSISVATTIDKATLEPQESRDVATEGMFSLVKIYEVSTSTELFDSYLPSAHDDELVVRDKDMLFDDTFIVEFTTENIFLTFALKLLEIMMIVIVFFILFGNMF